VETTRLSEFTAEETADGVLLRHAGQFPETDLDTVAGCLHPQRNSSASSQEQTAVEREVTRRRDGGRY
jgi:hypothetical protein